MFTDNDYITFDGLSSPKYYNYSTDKIKAIISPEIYLTILNKFENYTSQRNFAIDQAKNNWILFIDADERLTPDLKTEIIETVAVNQEVSAYLFYRKFYFKKRILRFSGWQTDRIFRLFKKNDPKEIIFNYYILGDVHFNAKGHKLIFKSIDKIISKN